MHNRYLMAAVVTAIFSFACTALHAERLVQITVSDKAKTRFMLDRDTVARKTRNGVAFFTATMHSYSTGGTHRIAQATVTVESCNAQAGTLYMTDGTESLEFAYSLDSMLGDNGTVSDAIAVSLCIMGNGNWDQPKART